MILFFISVGRGGGGAQEVWLEMGCPLGPPKGTCGKHRVAPQNEGENYFIWNCVVIIVVWILLMIIKTWIGFDC